MIVIVPYRDRLEHLGIWMPHLVEYLRERHIDHKITVIEQAGKGLFNRGALLNAGVRLSHSESEWFVLHDVDMLPISSDCDYEKPVDVGHVSNSIEQFGFQLPYRNYLGGVVACTADSFTRVNGLSNRYAGWGCEDDDFFMRCVVSNLHIERRGGVFRSLPHAKPPRTVNNDSYLSVTLNSCFSGTDVGVDYIDPRLFRRVDPGIFTVQQEAVSEHIDNDGLGTVIFDVLERCPIRERFSSLAIVDERHEIVTVRLHESHSEAFLQ